MAPRKKTNANTGKGRRLTADQKSAIAGAPADVTNVMLAEQYDTTVNTIARYRKAGSSAVGSGRQRGPGKRNLLFTVEGDYIVVKIPKRGLLKHIVGDLLA